MRLNPRARRSCRIYTAGRARRWENKTSSGGHYSLEGTIFTSEFCPAGQYSPVNSVRGGDIIHWGTLFTATPVTKLSRYMSYNSFTFTTATA